jgi:uncharacterized delta-60 repeat protein
MLSDHLSTRLTTAVAGALAVGALAAASAAQAAPGDLDSGFGAGGIVLSDLSTDKGSTSDDVAVQADGKVVVLERGFGAGVAHLLRYLPGGTPDPSFSGNGISLVPSEIRAGDLALQRDGGVVVSGFDATGGFAVARFLSNGKLDDTFDGDSGNANGVVHTQLTAGLDVPTALTIDDQNRIVVAGHADTGDQKGDVGIVRYLPDGSLDKSYAGDGSFVFSIPQVEETVWDVTTQDDGKVVVAGGMFSFPNTDTMLQRTTEDGKVDKFGPGNEGRQVIDLHDGSDAALSVAVQPDGRLLVGSDSPGEQDRLVRLSANGDLDTGFAGGGIVPLGYDISALALAPDGKIALAGSGKLEGVFGFAVERRNADGTPDSTFAGGAPVLTRVVPGEKAFTNSVAVASDGKIVAGGETGGFPDTRAAIVRYQGAADPPSDPVGTGAAAGSGAMTTGGALTLSDVRVTNRAFAVGRKATPRVGQAQAALRRKRGTAFRFRLNRTATVTIRIKRLANSRKTRVVRLKRVAHAGGNRVRFSGRVGRRALRPGRYRARLAGIDLTGSRSKPRTVRFRILRG